MMLLWPPRSSVMSALTLEDDLIMALRFQQSLDLDVP